MLKGGSIQTGPALLRRTIFRFEGFTFDLARGSLADANGDERPLRPKAYKLLKLLVENAGRLISRSEILDAVWPGITVTDDSISLCVREVRRALGDESQRLIRTVPRRGYVFAAKIPRPEAAPAEPEPPGAQDRLPGQILPAITTAAPRPGAAGTPPVLAVLPFANRPPERDQDYLADGLTEDLITALSHHRWFSVIARGSAFVYKAQDIDVRRVGRELGADYLLEGSIRRSGAKIRVSAQLSAAENGCQIWAQRFDSDLQDIFTLQDHIVEAVAGLIEPNLQRAEVRRAQARSANPPGAYDLYLRALHLRWQGTREGSERAAALLRQALALNDDFAAAWALSAELTGFRVSQGWDAPGEARTVLEGVRRMAERGATEHPSALAWAGYAISYLGRDYAAGCAATERALALAPNSAQILYLSGYCLFYAGQWRRATAALERAMRLSPMDPLIASFHVALAAAYFTGERYEQAVASLGPAVQARRDYLIPRRLLAASLAQLGRIDEARAVIAEIRAASPTETVTIVAQRTAFGGAVLDRYLDGLRKAGLPD
jgi:TolB-like protein/DNA-binding winged helix-turn-helix (wHTH) protein